MAEGSEETPTTNDSSSCSNSESPSDGLGAGGGSWWGSWLNSAKTKTSTVFEAVKKDLDELSTAVRTEASNVSAAIESTLKFDEKDSAVGTVKKSISSFLDQVTGVLIPAIEDDDVETVLITNDGFVTLTGFPKHLAELQMNDKTYVIEPDRELAEKYKRWMEVIEQDQFTQDRLSRHLGSSEILNEKYQKLVPEQVPHMDFWQRYLFKRALLEDALASAEMAELRAKSELSSTKTISPRKAIIQTEQPKLACKEEEPIEEATDATPMEKSLEEELRDGEIDWQAEDIPAKVEISEAEQIRLLQEYEQEIQEREKRKQDEPPPAVLAKKPDVRKQSPEKKPTNTKKNTKPSPSETKKSIRSNTGARKEDTKTKLSSSQSTKEAALKLQKDHFKKEESSSTSDESWEKDFDINE